jgi:large subunit ribosomal protein L20
MVRVKYAPARRKKKKRLFRRVKGARGARSRLLRTAKEGLRRSLVFSYRDRRAKKRTMRRLWIARINAALKEKGLSYNKFMAALKKAKINLDRKVLADLALREREAFDCIVENVTKK